MRNYFENLYYTKLGNTKEIDKPPGAVYLQKLNQEDINYFKRSVTSNEIETVS
jgi:hypothetical protein